MSTIVPAAPAKRKGRTVIDSDGIIFNRTVLMPEALAFRFARCLRANHERFDSVNVVRSPKATGRRNCYVKYLSNNPRRQTDLAAYEQEKRFERAASHGPNYEWFQDTDDPRLWFCYSDSGEVYECRWSGASFSSCSCPDSTKGIARRLLLVCKHRLDGDRRAKALLLAITPDCRPIETADERRARIMADRDRDFCDGDNYAPGRAA